MGASSRRLGRRLLAVSALVSAAGLVAFAWRFHVRSWRDVEICCMMSRECHPVWKDLFLERVTAGDDAEEVLARTGPATVKRFGRYVLLSYQRPARGICFTGVTILAQDGRLVTARAWSCTWRRVFFDSLPEEDRREFSEAFDTYLRDRSCRPPAP